MQQQNNHIKPMVDPELIRRYLAGELDDKAMHALERQALDDPFLADALEGFEEHAPDQRPHLADLQQRLAQRIQQPKRKVVPLYIRWAAAAAVCMLVGSSIIWLWPSPVRPDIAKVTTLADTIIPSEIQAPVHVPESMSVARKAPEPKPVYKAPVTTTPAPALVAAEVAAPTPAPATEADTMEVLNAQNYASKSFQDEAKSSRSMNRTAAIAIAPAKFTGRVLNFKGDSGIAGVSVVMNNMTTVSDREGYFNMYSQDKPSESRLLMASAPGYQPFSKTITGNQNGLMKIHLKKLTDTLFVAALKQPAPIGGFDEYKKYLQEQVQYPTGSTITGKVRLSFLVQPDGSLTDFKVTKQLDPACDQEAIRLIKAGPAWRPSADGKATRVKVEVKFAPAEN